MPQNQQKWNKMQEPGKKGNTSKFVLQNTFLGHFDF